MTLFPLEGNALKAHRKNPAANSYRLKEAISVVLFRIQSHVTGEEYDLSAYLLPETELLAEALQMAFDPFVNPEIMEIIQSQGVDCEDKEALKKYYKEPVICLLRIKDSVDTWGKQMGANGYFVFIENYMGSSIPRNEEYKFSVMTVK
ncbi:MAG: hypothetical protein SO101_03200, partial [Lachnospiraceae bacterium]|nr:hypothetical protein [Lachnospiraceae bacterium]